MSDPSNPHHPAASINPALRSLPDGFDSWGDPIPENPFPVGSDLHGRWADVTAKAEELIARTRAEFLQPNESPSPPSSEGLSRFLKDQRAFIVKQYDVWAWRLGNCVVTDTGLKTYDRWLVDYANAWLASLFDHLMQHNLPPGAAEEHLRSLQDALGASIYHWKATLRHSRDEMLKAKAEARAKAPGSRVNTPTARRVEAYIEEVRQKTSKKITKADFWREAGFTEKTPFMRWQREDPNTRSSEATACERVLREKPHLK